MTRAGIYIPLPQHITGYCAAGNFLECVHYKAGCEAIRVEAEKRGILNSGRRAFPRVPFQAPIAIAIHRPESPAAEDHSSWGAHTLDISMGGLRLASSKELPPQQAVWFAIQSASSQVAGIGEVRWTRHHDGLENPFLAGIAFYEQETGQRLGAHLRLSF